MAERVLVVEDDPVALRILSSTLEDYDFYVIKAVTGNDALSVLKQNDIGAVILDINLPDTNGLEILKYIRSHPAYKSIAVLIVTNNDDRIDAVVGLEIGADDYITKPFYKRELVARLNTVMRRTRFAQVNPGSLMVFNDLEIDMEKRTVRKNGRLIELSFKEFEILSLLASNAGKAISRETILNEIGGSEYTPETRTVDMHISCIRRKLKDSAGQNKYIDTISSVGYRFRE